MVGVGVGILRVGWVLSRFLIESWWLDSGGELGIDRFLKMRVCNMSGGFVYRSGWEVRSWGEVRCRLKVEGEGWVKVEGRGKLKVKNRCNRDEVGCEFWVGNEGIIGLEGWVEF